MDATSFSSCRVYVPLSGRTLGVMISSLKVDLVVKVTRSSLVLSSFAPKVHLATGIGYPVTGTLMVRGRGTITSRPSLKALRSNVGPTEEVRKRHEGN